MSLLLAMIRSPFPENSFRRIKLSGKIDANSSRNPTICSDRSSIQFGANRTMQQEVFAQARRQDEAALAEAEVPVAANIVSPALVKRLADQNEENG
jgi:hypothetical protein